MTLEKATMFAASGADAPDARATPSRKVFAAREETRME
jgi:hypothetical protein